MTNIRTRDYEGPRLLDPQCAPDYAPEWRVVCDGCGIVYKVASETSPVSCAFCDESDADALTIREVTP